MGLRGPSSFLLSHFGSSRGREVEEHGCLVLGGGMQPLNAGHHPGGQREEFTPTERPFARPTSPGWALKAGCSASLGTLERTERTQTESMVGSCPRRQRPPAKAALPEAPEGRCLSKALGSSTQPSVNVPWHTHTKGDRAEVHIKETHKNESRKRDHRWRAPNWGLHVDILP